MTAIVLHRLWFDTDNAKASAYCECLEPHVLSVFRTVDEFDTASRVDAVCAGLPDMDAITIVLKEVAAVLGGPVPKLMVELLPDRDWVRENQAQFPPITVGRYFIHGDHFDGRPPLGRIALRVDPGAAFGSGEHATTAGCLSALDDLMARRFRPARVLDVGCGTGILGLAAAKALKVPVIGSDLDPLAVQVARENAARNGCRSLFRGIAARGYAHPAIHAGGPYDLIFCNILARPVRALARDLARHLAPGGRAVLSGFYDSDFRWVLGPQEGQGLVLTDRKARDGWLTLVLKKPV
ncbi:MAG: 50S ribosomal protein L11 methyltransferase [Rhodospirillales bacterium]